MDSIEVDVARGVYVAPTFKAVVRTNMGKVFASLGGAIVEFSTTAAHEMGLALVKKSATLERNEFVDVKINGRSIHLMAVQATNLGVALIRKADFADDWQLSHGPRRVRQ